MSSEDGITRINPQLGQVKPPEMLRDMPAWLCWKSEQHPGEAKPRKVPYYASGMRRTGVQGSVEDRRQLLTFKQAQAAAIRLNATGLGFALMPEFELIVLDLDRAIDSNGVIHPQALRLTSGTYAEISPSGTGLHAFFRGTDIGNGKNPSGVPFGLEVFCTKGYVTFSGNITEDADLTACENYVAPIPELVLREVLDRFGPDRSSMAPSTGELIDLPTKTGTTLAQATEYVSHLDPDMSREKWLQVGMGLHHEYDGSDDAFSLFDTWSENSPNYGVGQSTQSVWDSFHTNRAGRAVGMPTIIKMSQEAQLDAQLAEPLVSIKADSAIRLDTPEGFVVERLETFLARPSPQWIIKGVLPQAGLGIIYGDSGSGKTFFILDMVLAIARGVEWRGRRVRRGRVIYVAAEGVAGFRNRVDAYVQTFGSGGVDEHFGVIARAPHMVEGSLDVKLLALGIQQAGGADVVVLDTVSRTIAGKNENAPEVMTEFIAQCATLADLCGAMVIGAHHTGKNLASGGRGHSSLRAATDVEFEVSVQEWGRLVRNTKQKDGEEFAAMGFKLPPRVIGVDDDLEEITSCVVEAIEPPEQGGGLVGAPRMKGMVLTVYNHVCGLGQNTGIEIDPVVAEIAAGVVKPEGRDTRKQHVRRSLNKLVEDGYLSVSDGCLSIHRDSDEL